MKCHFDQGDCCGNDVDTIYCIECICFENLNCSAPLDLIGNGVCNDETNSAECQFDGGECCATCINTEYCTECLCHAEGAPTLDISCKYISLLCRWNFICLPLIKDRIFLDARRSQGHL